MHFKLISPEFDCLDEQEIGFESLAGIYCGVLERWQRVAVLSKAVAFLAQGIYYAVGALA